MSKSEILSGAAKQTSPTPGLRWSKANVAEGAQEISGLEAIEIVRALRMAKADALVSDSSTGPVLSLLEGADEPYRIMVDAIGEGAVVLYTNGDDLFANPAMFRLV